MFTQSAYMFEGFSMVCENNITSVEPPLKTQKFQIPKVLIEELLEDHIVG